MSQVRILFDQSSQQLYVTVMQAVELPSRPGGLMRSPYVKMYLLPGMGVILTGAVFCLHNLGATHMDYW